MQALDFRVCRAAITDHSQSFGDSSPGLCRCFNSLRQNLPYEVIDQFSRSAQEARCQARGNRPSFGSTASSCSLSRVLIARLLWIEGTLQFHQHSIRQYEGRPSFLLFVSFEHELTLGSSFKKTTASRRRRSCRRFARDRNASAASRL